MPDQILPVNQIDKELKGALENLGNSFKQKYKSEPDFYVRIPGRVNLIGEHVDYCGYSVCPMAIKQCILAAVKQSTGLEVKLSNVDSKKFADYSCKIDNIIIKTDPNTAPNWYEYLLCGLKGIIGKARDPPTKGLIIHVIGTIPPSSGLSSSSALVCCAALCLSTTMKMCLTKLQLAELTAHAECHIGTEGGGMDQAIIFNAKRGSASHISFNPLRLEEIQIPPAGTFVIAQSMATKNKAASNDFNTRVVECRLSALIIAKHHLKDWKNYTKLADIQKVLKCDLGNMLKSVKEIFHDAPYSKEEVCNILDLSETELEGKFLTRNTKHLESFKLKQRALHVFGEALRVEMFCELSESTKSLEEMGRLMSESHLSLKDLYECSHVEVDKLVAICSINGALGARLTGAGWGGCVVALVPLSGADEFVKSVKAAFYANKTSSTTNLDNLIFITKPYGGASVISLQALDD